MVISEKSSNFAADFALMVGSKQNIIALDRLEVGHYEYDFQIDDAFFQALEKTEVLGGKVTVSALLDLREKDLDLRMKMEGTVQVICDRCLDPMDEPVDVDEEVEADEDAKELDLNWLAYELISINLPLVHRHPDGGCNPQMDALLQNHLCSTVDDPEEIDA